MSWDDPVKLPEAPSGEPDKLREVLEKIRDSCEKAPERCHEIRRRLQVGVEGEVSAHAVQALVGTALWIVVSQGASEEGAVRILDGIAKGLVEGQRQVERMVASPQGRPS